MKADVLEQIVDDYLQLQGYFTTHNVRFNPPKDPHYVSRTDSLSSDIDVVAFHPLRTGLDRVMVVSCRSWQSGYDATRILAADWFRQKIQDLTGSSSFTYCLAVTSLKDDAAAWADDPVIQKNLSGNPLRFLTLEQMWGEVLNKLTSAPAASELGRLAQLLKAAGLTHAKQVTALPIKPADSHAGAVKPGGQGMPLTL